MHGTFSQSILRRPIWSVLEPVLRASDTRLQGMPCHLHPASVGSSGTSHHYYIGCESERYDFSFDLSSSSQPLHILLLTSSSLEATNKQETISRLQHFSNNSSKIAVAFLLSEKPFTTASGKYNLDGLLALQVA